MNYATYARYVLVVLPIATSDCNCNESLKSAAPNVPQIDVCTAPGPGTAEVCYEAERTRRQAELCAGGDECRRPDLETNVGDVTAASDGLITVRVKNVGEATLWVDMPMLLPGSSSAFRLEGVEGELGNIEPGGELTFDVKLRGAPCGPHTGRLAIYSDDAQFAGNAPQSFDPGVPDNPVFINLAGRVAGPCMCPPPEGVVDFGTVPLGQSKLKRHSFESCGTEALSLDGTSIGVDPGGVFGIDSTSYTIGDTLEPGDTGHVDVKYTPVNENGNQDLGQLWIDSNDLSAGLRYTVYLVGRGAPRPACRLGALPTVAEFGQVADTRTREIRLFNEGEIPCRLHDISQVSGSTDFTLGTGVPPPDITIFPTQSEMFQIVYTTNLTGPQEAVFRATADDPGGEDTVDITVRANPEIPSEGCVLQVQPDFGDFGEISVGEISSESFEIANLSEAAITDFDSYCKLGDPPFSLASGAPDFKLGDTSGIIGIISGLIGGIPPGLPINESLTVYFEPQSDGIKTGTLRFNLVGEAPRDIPLWGNALGSLLCVDVDGAQPATVQCPPAAPCATVDFGSVAPPAEETRNVTLTNCGAGRLELRGINMDPAGGLAFIKLAPAPANLPIGLTNGQSATIQVKYKPNAGSAGDFGGIDVLSNAQNAEVARIDLRGNYDGTCTRIIRCNPPTVAFGVVETETSALQTAVCNNFGTENMTVNNVTYSGDPALNLAGETYAELSPGDGFTVQVSCTPTSDGSKSGTIRVESTSCDTSPYEIAVQCEAVTPQLPECIGSSHFEPREKWRWEGTSAHPSYADYDDVWMTPVVINLTDDNADGVVDALDTPDVVFAALKSYVPFMSGGGGGMSQEEFCHANDSEPAIVVAVSGDTGEELWAWGVLPVTGPEDPNALAVEAETTLAAGDIDADGLPEIIGVQYVYIPPDDDCDMMTNPGCCIEGKFAYGGIIALEHDGTYKWTSERWHLPAKTIENGGAISLGDMDGDGFPEIAFGNAVFDHNGMLLFEGETATTANPGHGEGGTGHGPFSVFADIDGDGLNELVAGRTAFDADGSVIWETDIGDGLTTVANVDNDNMPEIVILAGGNDLYVLEGESGAIKYGPRHIVSGNVDEDGNEEGFISTNAAVGDVDGDGFAEIVVAATNFVHVYEHDLVEKDYTANGSLAISDQTGASGPTTYDFEGDGRAEIMHADEGDVYLWDGADGTLKYQAPRNSRTIFDNPVVADVDNDGHADILLAMETPEGPFASMHGIILYGNYKNNWTRTRRVWNQHGYHITNISESGVIPAVEGTGWMDHNVYRSNIVRCE